MASAGFDCRLLIWDLEQRKIALRMDPLPQPVRLRETRETQGLRPLYMRAILYSVYTMYGESSVQCIGIHLQDTVWEISVYSLY